MALSSTIARPTIAAPRFVQLKDVAEVLNITAKQTYALVRSGELSAIKVGAQGRWRIEMSVLEKFVDVAPFGGSNFDSGIVALDY